MQFNCMMGVFPEISRAWLTIDNDIFMWNYEDGCVFLFFYLKCTCICNVCFCQINLSFCVNLSSWQLSLLSLCLLCRGDVAYFDGLIETILAVGLVKPKQGMTNKLFNYDHFHLVFSPYYKLELFLSSQVFYSHTFTTSWCWPLLWML